MVFFFLPYGMLTLDSQLLGGSQSVCLSVLQTARLSTQQHANSRACQLPTAHAEKKKIIPAHVGRNIHYVIITRAIVLMTSCLNQGCQG